MRAATTFILSCFLVVFVKAQNGKIFPSVKGIALDDKAVSLPIKNGKYSVIAIAFHRGAEDDLKKWLNPLFESFIKTEETKGGFDMAEIHDVNFAFIPLIAGFKRIAEDFKANTDKNFWPYIVDTEKTDVKTLQQNLGIGDNKIPYFFVLDASGKIVASESGKYSATKLEKLESAVE